jgi:hypothetical protein
MSVFILLATTGPAIAEAYCFAAGYGSLINSFSVKRHSPELGYDRGTVLAFSVFCAIL